MSATPFWLGEGGTEMCKGRMREFSVTQKFFYPYLIQLLSITFTWWVSWISSFFVVLSARWKKEEKKGQNSKTGRKLGVNWDWLWENSHTHYWGRYWGISQIFRCFFCGSVCDGKARIFSFYINNIASCG